jgi:catechol 2,3-dioxygenase-like lactoylglutathione lyase family enzyme
MFDHVTIRVLDREAAERFYDTVLPALGADQTHRSDSFTQYGGFGLTASDVVTPPTEQLHLGFAAPSREQVDLFWKAGTDAGYTDDGPPGPRPQYLDDYYGAFLRDPDGNSAEAVHHAGVRRGGSIDHLWIRVADVAAAKRFYETIAPTAGFVLGTDTVERVSFNGAGGSFSLVAGPPITQHLHMAFPTTDDADVRSFHETAVAAGYPSNGEPGERARYHPGYYSAFVIDPDGNNIEVVNHNRDG